MQIESLSVTFHGHDLIVDSELELNYGRLVNLSYYTQVSLYLCIKPLVDTFMPFSAYYVSYVYINYLPADVMACLA